MGFVATLHINSSTNSLKRIAVPPCKTFREKSNLSTPSHQPVAKFFFAPTGFQMPYGFPSRACSNQTIGFFVSLAAPAPPGILFKSQIKKSHQLNTGAAEPSSPPPSSPKTWLKASKPRPPSKVFFIERITFLQESGSGGDQKSIPPPPRSPALVGPRPIEK